MKRFICERLELSPEEAAGRAEDLFPRARHDDARADDRRRVDPHEFLAFVHDVDLACVPPNPALVAALAALAGPQDRPHQRLGAACRAAARSSRHQPIRSAASSTSSPPSSSPSRRSPAIAQLLRRHAVGAETALMVEDMAKNLVPAAAARHDHRLGARQIDWAATGADGDHIHYVVDDLGRLSRRRRGARPTLASFEVPEPCPSPTRSATS